MDLWQLFSTAWTSPDIRAREDGKAQAYQDLQRSYAEPHRRHHVWYHVEKGLELIEEFRSFLARPDWVVLAYFYHDKVFDVRRQDNEEASARQCSATLRKAHAKLEAILYIHGLIMDTAHAYGRTPMSVESKLIVSVDLATLGFSPDLFQRYSANIFKEFVENGGMRPEIFFKGQAAFFQSMLNREVIYPFPPLRERYEVQARLNLRRALAQH